MPKFLFIVARQLPRVHEHLRQQFAAELDVEVIFDRRKADRRQPERSDAPSDGERRVVDRRQNPTVDEQLRVMGYAFVRLDK